MFQSLTKLTRRDYALWGWAVLLGVSLFFSDLKVGTHSVVFYWPELLIYAALVGVIIQDRGFARLADTVRSLPAAFKLAAGLILIGAAVGGIFSPLFPQSLGALKAWFIAPMLLALLVLHLKVSRAHLYSALTLLGVGFVVIGLIKIGSTQSLNRLNAIYQSPNTYGMLIAPIVALLYITFREKFLGYLKLVLPTLLLLAAMLVLTRSLGALIGLVVVIGGYELTRHKRLPIVIWVGLVLLSVLIFQRLTIANNSLQSRVQIWHAGLTLVERSPLIGIGLRGFEHYYPTTIGTLYTNPIETTVPQAHNLLLSIWTNTGLVGLLGFAYLFWYLWRRKLLTEPAWWALVAIFIHGLDDSPYWRLDLAILFWLYVVIILLANNETLAN